MLADCRDTPYFTDMMSHCLTLFYPPGVANPTQQQIVEYILNLNQEEVDEFCRLAWYIRLPVSFHNMYKKYCPLVEV